MEITLYHGSTNIIEKPLYGYGKLNNDYGLGFYCTEIINTAGEWACQHNEDGYINVYSLNTDNLSILNLQQEKYNILNWLAILVANRAGDFSSITNAARDFLLKRYLIDTEKYDVIEGWRADDSYFTYTKNFLSNSLSLESLNKALYLGNLGNQVVLKSKKAFENIKFIKSVPAKKKQFFKSYFERDEKARKSYQILKNTFNPNETYFLDIMKNPKIVESVIQEYKRDNRKKLSTEYNRSR